jgi:hypothetical protein
VSDKPDIHLAAEWLPALSDDDFRELRRAISDEVERRGLKQERERSESSREQGRKGRAQKG